MHLNHACAHARLQEMWMTDLSYGTVQVVCKYSAVPVANSGGICTSLWWLVMYIFAYITYSGGSRGVSWVPWNPCFEGLPSKVLCTNIVPTLATHFSFNSSNNTRVSNPVSRIRLAHGLHALVSPCVGGSKKLHAL